eukprot:6652542-Prymnesium_polylepis.1
MRAHRNPPRCARARKTHPRSRKVRLRCRWARSGGPERAHPSPRAMAVGVSPSPAARTREGGTDR